MQLHEEYKELQQQLRVASKNYDDELRQFQKRNIIDSFNAEKVKAKFDIYQDAKNDLQKKQEEIDATGHQISQYLTAMNGMAIRYRHQKADKEEVLIFDMETNDYGESNLLVVKEDD
jgi:hypothetical protein